MTLSSPELYGGIHSANIGQIRSGEVEVDAVLSARSADLRRGVSLIIPIQGVSEPYRHLVEALSAAEPDQYFYPVEDLHVTVFDFVQARTDYASDAGLEDAFLGISQEAAGSLGAFDLRMRGIVYSRAAGMMKGYDGNALVALREDVRRLMRRRGLRNDERYESHSAHITFTRFRRRLLDPERLAEAISRHSEAEIGTQAVSRLELVEHDWYNSNKTKRVIAQVPLGP